MAWRTPLAVAQQDRFANRDDGNADLFAAFDQEGFAATRRRGRRMIIAVRRDGQVFARAEDAHQVFCLVVIGREVLIRDGPVFARAVLHRFQLEVPLGHPQRDARPGVGAPADDVDARPVKVSAGRGGVTVNARMDVEVLGVGADLPQPVVLARLAQPAKRHLVRPRMLRIKLFIAIPLRADFEQQDVEAFVDQHMRCDAARGARSYNDRVINLLALRHVVPEFPVSFMKMCRESTTLRQKAPSDASTAWRPHEIRLKYSELVKKTMSEGQAQAKLQPAHRAGRVNHAKSRGGRARRNGGARRSEVHNVERIRALGPEPKIEALAQFEVTRDSQVNDVIARTVEKVARRIAVGGDAGHDLVLDKGGRIEPLLRRRMVKMGIPDQLRTVVGVAIEVGVYVAVGKGERLAAAYLD